MSTSNETTQPLRNQSIPYLKTVSFLKKQPDFYLIMDGVKYPVHRQFLKKSQFLSPHSFSFEESACVIPETINTKALFHILYYMYTQIIYQLDAQALDQLIQALRILEVRQMQKDLCIYISNHLDKFRLLMLFNTAISYEVEEIQEIVLKELVSNDFKQLVSDKDIYSMGTKPFIKIIKSHNEFKTKMLGKGCSNQQIGNIIKSYEQINNCFISNLINQNDKNPEQKATITIEELKYFEGFQQDSELSNQFNQKQEIEKSSSNLQFGQVLYNKPSPTNENVEREKIHGQFMNLDLVASPVMNNDDFEPPNLTFGDWGLNQNNKFLTIHTKDEGWISEESSNYSDEQQGQENLSTRTQMKPNNTQCIPSISKHFVV